MKVHAIARTVGRNHAMPDERAEHVMRICGAIISHLERNPLAADTAKGIADFWLPGEPGDQLPLVVAALEQLTSLGLVDAESLPDGTVIYRKAAAGSG
jgi:hypothetical protein